AGNVIAVMVRVDEPRDRFAAANLLCTRDKILRGNRTLQRVDGEQVVRSDDQPRVRDAGTAHVWTAALRVGVDVGSELAQLAAPRRRQRVAEISRRRRRRVDRAPLRGKLCASGQCRGRAHDDTRTRLKRFTTAESLLSHLALPRCVSYA